jgi:hypothetical protein
MKIDRFLVPALAFALSSCTSSSLSGPAQDPGLEGDDGTSVASAPDKNPYGVDYPIDNIGYTARTGSRPGNRIQNYKFLGYPDADKSKGLQPISLAQFFDPEGRKYKLIHIVASAVWCPPCQAEAEMVTPLKSQFEAKKIVWLVSMVEGPARGTPSKQKDLDGWINQFKSPYTHWLDPSNDKMGPFYDIAAIPWNANINAETMEILSSKTGAPATEQDLWSELDEWLGKINGGGLK